MLKERDVSEGNNVRGAEGEIWRHNPINHLKYSKKLEKTSKIEIKHNEDVNREREMERYRC